MPSVHTTVARRRRALIRQTCAALLTLSGLTFPAAADTAIALYGSTYLDQVSRALDHVGLAHTHLERGSLDEVDPDSVDALFLAYDASADPGVASWLRAFRGSGGRLFTFFVLPPEIQDLMGIRQLEFVSARRRGQFAQIRSREILPYMPRAVHQRSWNIYTVEALGDSVQVASRWHDADGRDTGYPALLVGPAGAHLTHVLLDGDPEESGRLYAALLGHYFLDTWPQAVAGCLLGAEAVGGGADSLRAAAAVSPAAAGHLRQSRQAAEQARRALIKKRYPQALEQALLARRLATTALAATQASRRGEFRGVWLADPEGLPGWDWPETARQVARSGFNAILARFAGAGSASYPSAVLPVDEAASSGGDLLRAAVKACRARDLELHVWKVCFNLRNADSLFVDVLRRQGRLQADARGQELAWLCPSHPANHALELAATLELARTYEIDGIHLDYMRYPHDRSCFGVGCRQRFEEQTGRRVDAWPRDVIGGPLTEAYAGWRRDQITALVRDVSSGVRYIRPDVQISAAVFPDWPRTRQTLAQDWLRWVEDGDLDFVIPMDYRTDRGEFSRLVRRQVNWVDGRAPLYIGIGAWQLRSPEDLLRQIDLSRRAGAEGFALFQLDRTLATRAMPLLDAGPTSSMTAPPHRGPVVAFAVRAASAGTDSIAGRALYAEGELVTFTVQLIKGDEVSWSAGAVSIKTLDGVEAHDLGELRQGRRRRFWPFSAGDEEERLFLRAETRLRAGDYRPVIHGQYKGPRGQDEFLRRGPILHVRSAALLDSLRSIQARSSSPGETGVSDNPE